MVFYPNSKKNAFWNFARQWRPKFLNEVLGQSFVTQALQHILQKKLIQGVYLFSGMRGVGKTTLARIFASCLNCEKGVTDQPCGICEPCNKISLGVFPDLVEVDAASRTKVEETRDLLEQLIYLPNQGRYLVYLIDEVHMLSTHSFNALLKSLEEPPSHVVFLLATTDPEKIPMTVLSRCLHFRLNPLSDAEIMKRMEWILTKEKIPFQKEALYPLTGNSAGSMRDALMLLQQAVHIGQGKLSLDFVESMLGLISVDKIFSIIEALCSQDACLLLQRGRTLIQEGFSAHKILESLQEAVHQAALYHYFPDLHTHQANQVLKMQMASLLSERYSAKELQGLYQMLILGRRDFSFAIHPEEGLLMILLRLHSFFSADCISSQDRASSLQQETKQESKLLEHLSVLEKLVEGYQCTGLLKQLIYHCLPMSLKESEWILSIEPKYAFLLNKESEGQLKKALAEFFKENIRLEFRVQPHTTEGMTLAQREAILKEENQKQKAVRLKNDPVLKNLKNIFDAEIQED